MTIQQLRYFVTAAECLNFSKTAEKHYTSQPVVSKWIGKLESELGEKLFERNRYSVKLTHTGELLYPAWKKVLEYYDMSLDAAGIGPGKSSLRIGCLKMLELEEPVLSAIRSFEDKQPDISVSVEYYGFRELEARFYEGELDVIFTYDESLEPKEGYEKKRLYLLPMFFAVRDDRHLPAEDGEALRALQSRPLLLLSATENRDGGKSILDICARLGLDFSQRGIRFVPNEDTLVAAVRGGKGVAVSGRCITNGSGGLIRLIPLYDAAKNYIVAARRTGYAQTPLKEFWDNYISIPECLSNSEIARQI